MAMFALGFVVIGMIALGLASIGAFSVGNLGVLSLALSAGCLLLSVRRGVSGQARAVGRRQVQGDGFPAPASDQLRTLFGAQPDPGIGLGRVHAGYRQLLGNARLEYAVLGIWFVVSAWLYFRPHEYVLGGADAGVYVNLSASIADTGGILIQDSVLADLDPRLYPALLRNLPATEYSPYYLLPGFYVMGQPAGEVTPQFYPLHPVWQAVAYGLGGVRAALLLNGLWALLSGLAAYLFVRRLLGWPVAFLALIGLSVNALQVWFARYPTTEMLTQLLLWLGLWALSMWLMEADQPPSLWGVLAGLTLGQTMLVRIDMYFLLAIPLLIGGWFVWTGRLKWAHAWFFLPMSLMAVFSFYHGMSQSEPYFYNTFGYMLQTADLYRIELLVAAAAGIAGLLLAMRYRARLHQLAQIQPWFLASIALGTILLAAYGWFIRPYSDNVIQPWQDWYGGAPVPNFDHENLLRLGWYLSPLGVWLGIAGMVLFTWKLNRYTVVVVGVSLFYSLLYLWRIQANPHQIYAMRRYIPVVVPVFAIYAAAFCGWLSLRSSRWFQGAAFILVVLWLGGLGWSARGLVSQVDFSDVIDQLDQFDGQLAPDSVIIFNDRAPVGDGDIWGTPLRFLYGHSVFVLRNIEALDDQRLLLTIARWQEEEGRTVYWAGSPNWLEQHDLTYLSTVFTVSTQVLESTYVSKPTMRLPYQRDILFHELTHD